ncbi:MAG: putative tRNA sulfurtransferase [Candidatus Moranbacteria bacterium GW2011_GWE1_36_7]|nr:MAG: putative tRNA sulfurtransferase [Candidatus Moranbacteria bacterium GW2011_GWD2_36_12]KKQ06997.1 MAG: putative tRNA sulfurtransferase [Candidatus Moranbacteria bacterium GW2011_GWE2_36_40]KKQ15613.1 MAG: putative tRNA sulfurtransferase [Candidatus Moranbacteria bacterium GW2011_GWE1_36_7]
MKNEFVLCHYSEIALKGGNRNFFERQLIENIKTQLEAFCPSSFEYVKKMSGGILIKLNENGIENHALVHDALMHTPGIANFSFATNVEQNIETLKNFCWDLIKNQEFETFRVTTQRSNKNFPMTSEEINREVGGYIYEKFRKSTKGGPASGWKSVSMKNPDCECKIFILNEFALVSMEKIHGLGGMPVGTGNKAMAMLSGGFDSPVAAFQILRRGVQLRYAHFHSAPYTSKASIEKVVALSQELKKFGSSTKLYLIPFADVQKEIMMKTPERFRVILYRRMMLRIAEVLAKKEKCLALITGDSIGQVASQTLENILAVSEAATLPIFRPLIGEDKEDIMQKAKTIGTYDISIQPHDDCCTRLMPKKPETRAKLWEVLEAEKELDIQSLIMMALEKTELKKIPKEPCIACDPI